ncbi:hypothetical protein FRX31_017488 [Thalictrum thalictroides]|uniref:F-box associated beta-propeller type 1 domain-containing protein n=1 Tax=Thalictrum thalictroides TaxID=46969 RepID=A0A7J6W6D0_THATH|nr:hypothetical protein FRX31_017488 [Thalictrum thalictroides]
MCPCLPDTIYHSFRGYASDKLDVFLNGSFYWIVAVNILNSSLWAIFIAKLNLRNEDYGNVLPPQIVAADELYVVRTMTYYTLGVLENCLCLVDSVEKELIDVWIRNNDHEEEAWSKKISIQTTLIAPRVDRRIVIPIKDNGEHILLVHNGRVILYNSASNTCRFFNIGEELKVGYVFYVFPIVGSLIRGML